MDQNTVTTHRTLDRGSHCVTRGITITSSIVYENPSPDPSGCIYYHEYATKRSAVGTADLMGHRYVLKLVFTTSSLEEPHTCYLATDGRSYDEATELSY